MPSVESKTVVATDLPLVGTLRNIKLDFPGKWADQTLTAPQILQIAIHRFSFLSNCESVSEQWQYLHHTGRYFCFQPCARIGPTVVTLKGRNSVNIASCELNRGDSESQSHPLQCGKLFIQL